MLNLSITDQIADLSFVLLFLPDYWVDNFTLNLFSPICWLCIYFNIMMNFANFL